ncbi:MAG: methyl-accepting chemotaxis protein [Rubrivivax sp.]|nr:MAG: methyl-accepting chemotaxis protein [Rubrivivax sp.]
MKRLLWMLPLLAIALGAITSYVYSRATNDMLEGLGRTDSVALSRVQSLAFALTSVADGFKSAAAAADAIALEAVGEKVKRLRVDLKRYADVAGHADKAAAFSKAFDAYHQAATKVAGLLIAGKAEDIGDSAQVMQTSLAALEKDLATEITLAQATLDDHIAQTQTQVQRGFIASLAASLLMLALSVGVSLASVKALTRQLGGRPEDATHIVQRIAGGDLSVPVQLKEQDERSLLFAMRGMQGRLSEVIGEVRDAVHQVNDAAGSIGQGNAMLSERSERQRQSLHASAASIDHLTASVRSNADSAEQARKLASRASSAADEGGKAVADAVSAMAAISDRARKIVEITSLIDGIAFQTNILALNAAVEAARAGEQGRGFSVVAGEVRSLAQRASAAAKDIKTLIDDSAGRIEDGSRHVNAAGAVMSNLVDAVKQVGHHVDQISTASAEQRSGIEHVNTMVAELSGHTEDNHKLVAEAGQASQLLQQVADQLGVAVGRFRLDDGSRA